MTDDPSRTLPDPAGTRAVLVGVHHYQYADQFPHLPAVANNITALRDTLTDPRVLGIPAGNVHEVAQPERASDIIDAVADAVAAATDTLLFYYSGHGLPDPSSSELYLALPWTRKQRRDTACRYEDIAAALRRASGVRRVLVVLDCCFSGRALSGMGPEDGLADRADSPLGPNMPGGRAYCVLTAAASTEFALAPAGAVHTTFTDSLLSCLNSGIPDGPALLDVGTIHDYVRADVLSRNPDASGLLPGTPDLGSRGRPDLVWIARNTAVPAPSSRPRAPAPGPPPARPVGARPVRRVPLRMGALVRAYLGEEARRVSALHLISGAGHGRRAVWRAMANHRLDPHEEFIAIWLAYGTAWWGFQSSVAFTTTGIRICRGDTDFLPYEDLHRYSIRVITRTERVLLGGDSGTGYDQTIEIDVLTGEGKSWEFGRYSPIRGWLAKLQSLVT
ncbi:caspase family protein [Streptomyces xiamenensis]|uniref:caspase family protein n=1 Tax=Streptomyces TaxID=1883 RepID=UPI001905A401|nr:caspase family protein [Streptomyces sp. XC 2026]QQN79489.1 caspase family protein [Streptomyces sp. XC 2026]